MSAREQTPKEAAYTRSVLLAPGEVIDSITYRTEAEFESGHERVRITISTQGAV